MSTYIHTLEEATVAELVKYCEDTGLTGYQKAMLASKRKFINWIYEEWGKKHSQPDRERKALEKLGFCRSPYTAEEERKQNDFAQRYKGWEIFLSIPNGGICACIVIKGSDCYQFPVGDTDEEWEFYFDYTDSAGVIKHAKRAIDAMLTNVW